MKTDLACLGIYSLFCKEGGGSCWLAWPLDSLSDLERANVEACHKTHWAVWAALTTGFLKSGCRAEKSYTKMYLPVLTLPGGTWSCEASHDHLPFT